MVSNKKTRAAGYIRVSSREQATSGESLHTQRKAIEVFIKAQGWKLTNIYADEGISGGSVQGRKDLQQLLKDAQNDKFDVLVVHRIDRFGRNALDLLKSVEILEKGGVVLQSINEGHMNTSTEFGKILIGFFALIAQMERNTIRDRSFENRIAKGKRGEIVVGRPPFARTKNKITEKLELDEGKAKKIKWAAKKYLNGGSLYEISHVLRTRTSVAFELSTFNKGFD